MTLQSVWLESRTWCAFHVCEQTVLHRCVLWVDVLSTLPVDFLEFFPGIRICLHFSDDVGCHEFQLVYYYEVGHCEVEDEVCLRISPWLSVVSSKFLRITDFIVDVDGILDVSISEIVVFLQSERLVFFVQCINKFWSLSKRLFGTQQYSNEVNFFGVL